MTTNTKPFVWDEEGDSKIFLPSHKEVCHRCQGEGTHVNPSIDGRGISASDEIWDDDEFRSNYFGGVYDVTCEECNGANVIDVLDFDLEEIPDDHPLAKEMRQWYEELYAAEDDRYTRWAEDGYLSESYYY